MRYINTKGDPKLYSLVRDYRLGHILIPFGIFTNGGIFKINIYILLIISLLQAEGTPRFARAKIDSLTKLGIFINMYRLQDTH